MTNWNAELLDGCYEAFAVDAVLTPPGGDPIRAVDQTAGVVAPGPVYVHTVRPACDVRASELAARGIEVASLRGATIAFNGRTWQIEAPEEIPLPDGPGEYRLWLQRLSGGG